MAILVLGATGFVGRALVDALAAAGESVRAASRRLPERPETRPGVTWVACDARDPGALAAAMRDVHWVYYLVHSMGSERSSGAGDGDFRRTEQLCAHNVAHAARTHGCERVIYLGGVAPRGAASEHLASRLDVGDVLRSGTRAIELRASMIIGNGSVSWQIVRDLSLRLPLMILPKWLESKSCPVALADVVAALLAARRVPLPESAWYDIPGPEVLTAREMLRQVGALRGRNVPTLRVPVITPRLSALWLKFVTGADYPVARELVLGLTGDLLPRDAAYWDLIGQKPKLTFGQAAADALATEARPSRVAVLEEALVERIAAK